ncbi:LytTR family DNA-binding domain-containing protein [Sphingomonas sp. Root720]|uniref:LytTR family DNA-binding domain-containing protein n=2 Tax=Sphingomonas TaxID=13687 RepID=UPI0006FC2C49|nr:LytTR family DNA-binding domain-containing protein [Sphingomonas sp. Root720]KQX25448.1 hypothetical protein ASD17_21895 [Sphingomonas sp. Root1294]KQY66440.1 hypothetical protein ASD39_11700 [Sphingomonas sp. Root50]KRB90243.1 hypothetical protein ASE22_15250 [Sphingomonas sp. Root720]
MDVDDLLKRPERWASVLGWATLAGLEFGLIGPFGSYASHVFTRIAYWTLLFWVGGLLLWPCVVAALALGPRRGFPPLFSGVAVILLACVPLAMLGAIGTHLFWPARAAAMHGLEWYGLTIVVALPAMAGLLWVELGGTRLIAAWRGRTPAGAPIPAPVLARVPAPIPATTLPDHLLAGALCLQMEDHHVRVHLHGRSVLHHAVMRKVVGALDERRGLQVHRSWWVARDAVRGWQRDGRSIGLILVNGLRVPVARNRVAILRACGWLDGNEE